MVDKLLYFASRVGLGAPHGGVRRLGVDYVSAYGTNLLFLLKTHTLLRRSSCLSPVSAGLLASLNIYIYQRLIFYYINKYKFLPLYRQVR